MFSSIIPHSVYDYLFSHHDAAPTVDDERQTVEKGIENSGVYTENPELHNDGEVAEVRSSDGDYVKVPLSNLLNGLKAVHLKTLSDKAEEIHKTMKKTSAAMKSLDTFMAKLIEASHGKDSISIDDKGNEELKKARDAVKEHGISSPLLDKTTLARKDIEAIERVLQHYRDNYQNDIKGFKDEFSGIVEKRNTLYQTLISVLSTIKQSIDQIFRSR